MSTTKQKLVTVTTTVALGCGFTFGLTPAFADSNEVSANNTSISSVQKQEQTPFTGYVISVDSNYLVVANTFTKDEALSHQNDWWELASQNKILRVPISAGDHYLLGEKLNVFSAAWTFSIPPIAVMPTIEKVVE
ncbi:DUF3221 domain-containing protein [Bacillus bombysepticus]|uniref:DUF3221 domain-containing protein n=1 Tax=Bacillus thuringiensis serovar kumamotoensis TaxID=132267 RepID=A0A9X6JPY4_BACUK|nr:DUF3221 domain-containing protein [Bacillus thuringiensis]MEC2872571.1 DUF3221 domain-containing protein [Bacillus cereus]OTZ72928.1 DUF3221 domain-containing protein [Bacillus thuringiensis serovar kumamtoensis]